MFSVNVEWIASPTIHILLNGLLPSVFMYIVLILCTPFVKEVISWLRVLMQMIQFLQLNISNIFTLKKKMNCVFQKCKA